MPDNSWRGALVEMKGTYPNEQYVLHHVTRAGYLAAILHIARYWAGETK
jgi:hypothetical protein